MPFRITRRRTHRSTRPAAAATRRSRPPRTARAARAAAPPAPPKTAPPTPFSNKDYASGDGFVVATWGPAQWHFLHTISFNFPVHPTREDKIHYRQYVHSLRHVLPCKYCRENLRKNLRALPLTSRHLASRDAFSRYIYRLHEHVNKMLGKSSGLTYEAVRDRYEHFRSRCTEDTAAAAAAGAKVLPAAPAPEVRVVKVAATAAAPTASAPREKGCTEPLYGKKSKCVISIVPQETKTQTFQVARECMKTRTRHRRPHTKRGAKSASRAATRRHHRGGHTHMAKNTGGNDDVGSAS